MGLKELGAASSPDLFLMRTNLALLQHSGNTPFPKRPEKQRASPPLQISAALFTTNPAHHQGLVPFQGQSWQRPCAPPPAAPPPQPSPVGLHSGTLEAPMGTPRNPPCARSGSDPPPHRPDTWGRPHTRERRVPAHHTGNKHPFSHKVPGKRPQRGPLRDTYGISGAWVEQGRPALSPTPPECFLYLWPPGQGPSVPPPWPRSDHPCPVGSPPLILGSGQCPTSPPTTRT
ncbi:basic proline-rich protein-like [Polistes fuscatus]|uniref:basic proline-rich protein-like n=1 Tax=Polistes fuscatus TaxID=30207 RepID=UPI001CA9BBF2|nr:basic proline-rich protein-like [Polistes fuscatus]